MTIVRVRDPQRLLFAAFLLVLGVCGFYFGWKLPMGTSLRMGAGYLPKVLSAILIAFGVGLAAASVVVDGGRLDRWAWRPLAIILVSLCLFGLLVERGGLLVTTVVVVLAATAAAPDRRWREATVFAVSAAILCTVLFRVLLNLPIPAFPW